MLEFSVWMVNVFIFIETGTLKMVTVQKKERKERKQKARVGQSGAYFSGPHLLTQTAL